MVIKDKLLIVEDENNISTLMTAVFGANGYDTIVARNGSDAISMMYSHCPDLIVLDLGLPDIDGMSIIKQIRAWTMTPIVVVSARTYETDKVAALDIGADDYITKPFGTAELLARVRTALRHTRTVAANRSAAECEIFRVGNLVIDNGKHLVLVDGETVHLTQNEFKILSILGKSAGMVLTYDSILKELWGPGSRGNNQILRVNMANIRRKIEKNPARPQYIFTEVGVGYRMAEGDNNH